MLTSFLNEKRKSERRHIIFSSKSMEHNCNKTNCVLVNTTRKL